MKQYRVWWEEKRYAEVEAKSAEEAEKLVRQGQFNKDYSDEITCQPEAEQICANCKLPEDDDGRCGCTNKDSK